MVKKCNTCGKEFEAKNNRTKYCSDERKKKRNALKLREYRKNMAREQKEMESQKAKARYEKRYIKEKKKVDKRECIICKEEFTPNFNGAKTKYCSQNCADEARRIRNRESYRRNNDLYIKYDKERKCKECGKDISEKPMDALFCNEDCRQTWYSREVRGTRSWGEYKEELEQQKEETARIKEAERKARIKTKACTECGQPFETIQPNKLTCSTECSRLRRNRLISQRSQKRYNDTNLIDKDITVKVLYKRDKGICYICGGKCDFKDHKKTNGHFTAGPTYPSIDHLIPIARGGMHAWDNVKLAHHRCNAMKSDTLPSELGLDVDIDGAYALAREVSPRRKEVKQFTKEGKLVAVYESTAEAERQLGIPRKTIQNNARGESKTAHGYIFEYV